MLGELIGIGLIGLAAKLGAQTKSNREFWEQFSDWVDHVFDLNTDVILRHETPGAVFRVRRPCTLEKRRALDSFKKSLDWLRKEVTWHPDFRGDSTLYMGCMDSLGGPEEHNEVLCEDHMTSQVEIFEDGLRKMMDYEKQLRAECLSVWTPDQGLERAR